MKPKFISRLAFSVLAILSSLASSSYACSPDSEACRELRKTAQSVRERMPFDGDNPLLRGSFGFPMPAGCGRDDAPEKSKDASRETKVAATAAAGVNLLASAFNARSPG